MTTPPRIELHLHLEGALPPAFVRAIAAEKGARLDGLFDARGGYAWSGFAGFLRAYGAVAGVLRGPRDFARALTAVAEARAADGVSYAEVFVCPDFCGGGDLGAWRDHLAAMAEAAALCVAAGGPDLRLIATCIRHNGPDAARAAALCAAETAGATLVGFGMAGDERAGTPAEFAWAFDCAREAGLGLTAHAGEVDGPASVRAVLEALRPARIGHAIRAVEDPALLDRLAREGVVLEVCPGANVALGLCDWASHPVARLRAAGVAVTLSTDDPAFFGTSLAGDAERLGRAFGWDAPDFHAMTRTALAAAFCDDTTREQLAARLDPNGAPP